MAQYPELHLSRKEKLGFFLTLDNLAAFIGMAIFFRRQPPPWGYPMKKPPKMCMLFS